MPVQFLTRDQVLILHRDLIDTYGGSHGLRDEGLLDSALAMPQAAFGGELLHKGIFEMAAAYLFHLVQNHPFVDGNKRIGTAAAIVFLRANGLTPTFTNDALVMVVIEVASGKKTKADISRFFRAHVRAKKNSRKS